MQSLTRSNLLKNLAQLIVRLPTDKVQMIAIDGADGAGKTTFADELATALVPFGRDVIRASVDGFHNPRETRYRRGRNSPEGFFQDSYDYPALKAALLNPLSKGGSGKFRQATFDCAMDLPLSTAEEHATTDSILLLDGIFLHRPELRSYWDFSIFLDVSFAISIPRGAQRGNGFGSPDPNAETNHRYVEGQNLYLRTCDPRNRASVLIDNNDLQEPRAIFREKTPALWDALTYGIDVSLLESNLSLSLEDRLKRHGSALALATNLMTVGKELFKT